ncbi:hypothetical protein VOLCADRAFT_86900 [Volvox carteri f. nagariensis]|uniref:Uncharacterized protein n=1 Tax=Volvox carteri f. nagariensis TaxID=3068 RepID=D8TKN3_VOLCA|nr:uncharacterized protein VOLCADRAFT_86900 [Volvox carteri f. nagariensis]EFJ51916.1 hypothetical protein VOLCADRAFT_86900 [Volvox carteri f. nagariensis]|eukprot:XP_002946690.1 hypothetical protein VOLCADRAFT_86900 [Volvox carteri f. nagariensis]
MGHIRFDSDDEDMGSGQGPQPSTSAPAGPPGTLKLPTCCGSARVDFNFNDPCYVFRALPSPSGDLVAASVSNHAIKLYQPSGPQLSLVGELRGHTGTVTDLSFSSTSQPYAILSSSADGSLAVWDVRSMQLAERYEVRNQEIFCHSSLEHVLAAGITGEVLFWDRRTRKPLAKLDDTHAEDVTQVRFHSSGRILSGSTDGLIAVHDVSKSFNDDDVFQAAININNSVEEFGLYGHGGGRLWVRTGTESVHLWEWLLATTEDVPGGDMQFADFPMAREAASQACAASAAGSIVPQVDYLVGCHYDSPTNQLFLVVGHNDGPVAFVPVLEQQGPQGNMVAAAMACPVMALTGGHSSIVRSLHCMGEGSTGPLCVTGGEDALVCMWTLDQELVNAAAAAAAASGTATAVAPSATGRLQQRLSPGPDRQHGQERLGGKNKRPSPY